MFSSSTLKQQGSYYDALNLGSERRKLRSVSDAWVLTGDPWQATSIQLGSQSRKLRSVSWSRVLPCRPPKFATSRDACVFGGCDLVAEQSFECADDGLRRSTLQNFSTGQAEANPKLLRLRGRGSTCRSRLQSVGISFKLLHFFAWL